MNKPNPTPLTVTHDDALNAARAALNGLTAEQMIVALAAVLVRRGLISARELTMEGMRARATIGFGPPHDPTSRFEGKCLTDLELLEKTIRDA